MWDVHFHENLFLIWWFSKLLLYVCVVDYENKVVASLVFDHLTSEGYDKVNWKVDASEDEVLIVHAFATSIAYLSCF